jgi:hypothetical protein
MSRTFANCARRHASAVSLHRDLVRSAEAARIIRLSSTGPVRSGARERQLNQVSTKRRSCSARTRLHAHVACFGRVDCLRSL